MAATIFVPNPIDALPDQSGTPATILNNLETWGISTLNQALPDTVNVVAPNGSLPFDPGDPNFRGLQTGKPITVQIASQRTAQNSMALLLIVIVIWAVFA